MKIESIRIQNFRSFEDQTVYLNDYTCLVGANGSGKSTVLTALRVFFRDTTSSPTDLLNLQEQDFHLGDTSKDIAITVTFIDLDAEAEEDFKHYVRQEKLIVSAIASWDAQTRQAEVKQYGERMVLSPFKAFFEADSSKAKASDLKNIYTEIRKSFTELPPPGTKQEMTDALRSYEAAHPDDCEPERSSHEFYGFTKGADLLRKHVEWVFVPAVKDASTEELEAKKTALEALVDRTVRSRTSFAETLRDLREEVEKRYAEILAEKQNALADLSDSLTKRLREWANPDAGLALNWRNDPSRNISIQEPKAEVLAQEGHLRLAISRMGHGLQRSFLLALLQELSGCPDTGKPKLLLACEEPELYQHPPQVRHLCSALQQLASSNAQVLVCTHSPLFLSERGFADARVLRREAIDSQPRVCWVTLEELSESLRDARGEEIPGPSATEAKIAQLLQPRLNEMFFTPVLILVEGQEDIGYIETYLALSGRYDEFRRLGCHIVPTSNKSNMVYTLAVANKLDIPTFVVFDADGHTKEAQRRHHERDNLALLRLMGVDGGDPFPPSVFSTPSVTVWPRTIGLEVRDDIGQERWNACEEAARAKHRIFDLKNSTKNALFIGMVLTTAYESEVQSKQLDALCNRIISFAREKRATAANPPAAPSRE